MASSPRGERTPLLGRNGGHAADVGVSRRRGPLHESDDDEYDEESFEKSYSVDDDIIDKQDRRSWWSRVSASLQAGLKGTARSRSLLGDAAPNNNNSDPTGQYYIDDYNEHPWRCTFGTSEQDGIWMNKSDQPGVIMAIMVWILIAYSGVTVTLLAEQHHLASFLSIIYCTICGLALMSHSKTMFTDPGTIPHSAVPRRSDHHNQQQQHVMCSHCQTFKPPNSHHCRICNRCIAHMDHHCPWMNNCVGAGNLKHFILFLCYTWTNCAFALIFFAYNYFGCASEDCVFSTVLIQLVRAMTVICIGALLFTSSMLMNVCYGVMTGISTIDRLKKKATNTVLLSDEEPIPLTDIFGIGPYWTWPLPIDPVFDDFDRVMGYSTPQRLLREQMREPPEATKQTDAKGYSKV